MPIVAYIDAPILGVTPMKTLPSSNVKHNDPVNTSVTTTSLVYDRLKLEDSGVYVKLDEVAITFDMVVDSDLDERDFVKFLDRWNYDALESDALLSAITKIHNKVMLSRILYRSTQ